MVLGAQWGDEGKGKVVDLLATEADLVCRCQVNVWIRDYLSFLAPFYLWIHSIWYLAAVWWSATGARVDTLVPL